MEFSKKPETAFYLNRVLSRWRGDPDIGGSISAWRVIPARQARTIPFPGSLHLGLEQALRASGIDQLYSHQGLAWDAIKDGKNIALVSGTASGKTLGYNLPVLDSLLRRATSCALYLFPTKALARDQLAGVAGLLEKVGSSTPAIAPSAYDGDTPSQIRRKIRTSSRLIFSNPDMLHAGILPRHTGWIEFFSALEFVVIDEMHTYRGVFGSHVANVIRRFKRIARHYGSSPQFILTSATIGNPAQLAERLIDAPIELIDDDGSALGPRTFLIYNPPIIDQNLGIRRSSLQEGVRIASDLLAYDLQTILFTRSRRSVELVLRFLREKLDKETARQIRGYRSGYLPAERRQIEQGLRSGDVRAVVATNALELGIDIGGLNAAVLVGYPGTIAGTWQQAGRAGRGEEPSLAVLVASAAPLDQFLASHPGYFFDRTPEEALINPDNLLILLEHLRCAAFELPFEPEETFGKRSGAEIVDILDILAQRGDLHRSTAGYYWMADYSPAQRVSLRSASAERVQLQEIDAQELQPSRLIGQVDRESVAFLVHPGAVYMHGERTYLVREIDLDSLTAKLEPADPPFYTVPRFDTQVQLIELKSQAEIPGGIKYQGEILVTNQLSGYRMVEWFTQANLGVVPVQLPPSELQTMGYWIALDESVVNKLRVEGLWNNDPNSYGPGWAALRAKVRERDGYRCRLCNAAETDRSHDVHHIQPFRSLAQPEEANKLSNLITLCPACHHKVETNVRVRSGLAGLAYVLNHLAPLFLMTDPSDLGVHSDPKSPLAEGLPSVILYDRVAAGIGFSQRLYEIHSRLLQQAHALVSNCPCQDGCPSCVGPGGENGSGGKRETLAILDALRPPGHGQGTTLAAE